MSSEPPTAVAPACEEFVWTDAHGRAWRIQAGPAAIELECEATRLRIDRATWLRDVHVTPVGGKLVIHFQTAQQDVGFVVEAEQGARLVAALRFDAKPRSVPSAPPRVADHRGPAWPVVTHGSVWALICAALAFLPYVGALFGLTAIALGAEFWLRSRKTPALLHARWMVVIAWLWAGVGLAVCALLTWSHAHAAEQYLPVAPRLNWGEAAAGIFVVLMSLSVHEAAHAITAWWLGDDYAHSQGRVTINPLAHIHLFGTILLPLLLAQAGAPVFGFARPVPVQLGNIRRFRRAHILISIAGPGSNLLLAALCLMLLSTIAALLPILAPGATLAGLTDPARKAVLLEGFPGASLLTAAVMLLKAGVITNVMLAAFNMIPVPPLDGSWVLENLFPHSLGRLYAAVRPYGFLVFLGVIYSDRAMSILLRPGMELTQRSFAMLWRCTGLYPGYLLA